MSPQTIWDLRQLEVLSVSCRLIFLPVCSLMQPPPAHPDTAADILCQRWKIAPARDGKIRKDCHDMHVVYWVKIRGAKSLEEFLLSAFIELSSEQRLNSLVLFKSERERSCKHQNCLHHTVYRKENRACWETKMWSKNQNSNWEGCRGPFQTCFASGTVCQLHFISVPPTKDAG